MIYTRRSEPDLVALAATEEVSWNQGVTPTLSILIPAPVYPSAPFPATPVAALNVMKSFAV